MDIIIQVCDKCGYELRLAGNFDEGIFMGYCKNCRLEVRLDSLQMRR